MSCQIKRTRSGEIDKVYAPNGKESIAYNSILSSLKSAPDISALQERYKPWEGKHIESVEDDKELALALYKQLYSPAFKNWFGDWEKLERVKRTDSGVDDITMENLERSVSKVVDGNGEPLVVYHGSTYIEFESFRKGKTMDAIWFTSNKLGAQMYMISQYNTGSQEGAGIHTTFLNIKNPFKKDYSHTNNFFEINTDVDKTDRKKYDGVIGTNVEEDVGKQDQYIAFDPLQIKSVFNMGQFSKASTNVYEQLEVPSITPTPANPATIKKIKEFLNRIGVEVKSLANITIDGAKLGINGVADPLNQLIQITQGKEDIALTEEAMHMAVEIIEQKNPALFRRLMNEANNYRIVDEVIQNYGNIPDYQVDGKPDIVKLKKEAIGKILAQTLINKAEDITEKPELLARVKNWWQSIIDFLKRMFLRANMNPFEETAETILKGEDIGHVSDITPSSGRFLQVNQDLFNNIKQVNANTAKTDEGYEVNGEKVRHTVDETVSEFTTRREKFRNVTEVMRANRETRQETERNMKEDIKDIFGRFIDDNGNLRDTPIEQTIPSSVDSYDNSYYTTLSNHIQERLQSYPSGTKFIHSVNLVDQRTSTAATVDLIALLDNGKVDVLQFHTPELGAALSDIPPYQLEAYGIEIEGIRKVLENGYGISRKQFRNTRVLPVRATYNYNVPGDAQSGLRLVGMAVGSMNVKLINDDVLLPVPGRSETTGNEQLDRFIHKLSGLAERYAKEKVPPDKILERSQKVARLAWAIRKLRVQANAANLLSQAKTIIDLQRVAISKLAERIEGLDPVKASIKEINEISDKILSQKDEIELYSTMYGVFQDVFTGGSEAEEQYIADARGISDNASSLVRRYWNMAVKFRTDKMAARLGIRDEFNPEKQLTWYRRMVRSISQSSTKAGAILWQLVKSINSRSDTQFQDRLTALEKIEEGVKDWLKGRNIKELYNKIFSMKDGKWNGAIIQRYSKQFYKDMREAQENQDLRWVRENIDVDAYQQWFLEEHQRRVDNSRTQRIHEDDERNRELITQSLQDFVNTFSIRTMRGINPRNYMLKEFPLDKWESDEYKELRKPENKAVMDLYKYWIDTLKESLDEGMIQEHNGWSWFPNVRRNLLEKLTTAKAGGKLKSLFGGIRIEAEDTAFGKTDPVTGRSVNEIHANYVSDLGEWVKDANDNYFKDYSEKSMDIFKVMALWQREIIKYKLKTESEAIARMLQYTEEGRSGYKTTRTGKLDKDELGFPILIDNKKNAEYIKDHLEAVWYGKRMSDESDVTLDIPYKAIVKRINGLFGKTVLDEPEQEKFTVSGVKFLGAVNRFFTTKTLGLNVFTSLSQLFGGSANTYMNQGIFFDKRDVLESELDYVSGRFWGSEQMKKLAGLISYLHIYTDDRSAEEIRGLSVSRAVRYLSSDHLFIGQRAADKMVNDVITMSFIKNTMVVNSELVNIRDYARKELGHEDKYRGTTQEAKDFEKRLENRVEELKKSDRALLNIARIENDQMVIPGVDRNSDTMVNFREKVKAFTKDALGNITAEDLSLYKRSVLMQSFAMFKNWIPRMLDVRFQTLKFVPGSERYEWGRMRMLGSAVINLIKNTNTSLLRSLSGRGEEDLITIAKAEYKRKQQEKAEQEEEFEMSEAEFIDMYLKGVRAGFKELGMAISMMGMLIAARAYAPDKESEPETKGAYKWLLRGMDKLQDEVSFFYNPVSFTNILNGSVFPAVGILVDVARFMENGTFKLFYEAIGEPEKASKYKASKYLFKIMPITKELMTYLAIFSEDFSKEYGVRLTSQYGNFR